MWPLRTQRHVQSTSELQNSLVKCDDAGALAGVSTLFVGHEASAVLTRSISAEMIYEDGGRTKRLVLLVIS